MTLLYCSFLSSLLGVGRRKVTRSVAYADLAQLLTNFERSPFLLQDLWRAIFPFPQPLSW